MHCFVTPTASKMATYTREQVIQMLFDSDGFGGFEAPMSASVPTPSVERCLCGGVLGTLNRKVDRKVCVFT